MLNADKPPTREWLSSFMTSFPWVSGFTGVKYDGTILGQEPANPLKKLDFIPLLYADKKQSTRALRADVQNTPLGPEVLLAVPLYDGTEFLGVVAANFDMRRTGRPASQIDLVAVSRGPGLLGSLLVGVAFAKGLALGLGKPLLGVNHLHAHLFAVGLEQPLRFPAMGLLVSGGHTHLYRLESPWDCRLLGRTLDDAAGEAFDKVGKFLGLAYPGGRLMDALARAGRPQHSLFPRPYLDNDNLDFSFSGLKTAATSLAAHEEIRPGLASV